MKKIYGIIVSLAVVIAVWACGPAETKYEETFYAEGLFTINKATVRAEFNDSLVFVKNLSDYGLTTGDRAHLRLVRTVEWYSGKDTGWSVYELYKEIPTRSLAPMDSVTAAEYDAAIVGLPYLDLGLSLKKPLWVWNGCQNMNILYKGSADADFAMSVRGFKNGCLELDLRVKADDAGTQESECLLTFDISNAADYLTAAQRDSLPQDIDKVKTRIYFNNGDSIANVLGSGYR